MYANFYTRKPLKRNPVFKEEKPFLDSIFALKHRARQQDKYIKELVLTPSEFETLQAEVNMLGQEIKNTKMDVSLEGISALLGFHIQFMDEINAEIVDKAAGLRYVA